VYIRIPRFLPQKSPVFVWLFCKRVLGIQEAQKLLPPHTYIGNIYIRKDTYKKQLKTAERWMSEDINKRKKPWKRDLQTMNAKSSPKNPENMYIN